MNETVVIKEGGLTRRLAPIDKLKVNTTDNKESTWVSAGKANTGVLHVSENGIYIASEDGYEAYSEVIVRVTKDSFEGDTSFDDWDYETPDMDLDNWDPETIEDFELDPDGFDDVFNNEDEWKNIDKPIDIKMDNPKIQDTKISGIDPVTGNEMEVGLDEDGYLTESTLPSTIRIEVPPAKLQYVDGQPILFRGMVVKAYTADGELWTDASHTDGVLQHSELTFPVVTAQCIEGQSSATSDLETGMSQPLIILPAGSILHIIINEYGDNVKCYFDSDTLWWYRNDEIHFMIASNDRSKLDGKVKGWRTSWGEEEPSEWRGYGWGGRTILQYSYNQHTVYYYKTTFYSYLKEWVSGEPTYNTGEDANGKDAWTMVFGDKITSGQQIIPVQYIRSDGEVLEDSFIIEVLPDPDGVHSNPDDTHTQVDPSTVEWNHRRYKTNDDLGAAEVRNGSVYIEGGAIYDVGAAVKLGMLEPVDNEIVP